MDQGSDMILSTKWRESGKRFFYRCVALCNQRDKSGLPDITNAELLPLYTEALRSQQAFTERLSPAGHSQIQALRTELLGSTAAPFPAPQLDRHSRSEITQAQGRAVKHYHCFSQPLFGGRLGCGESQFLGACTSGTPDTHPKQAPHGQSISKYRLPSETPPLLFVSAVITL